MPDMIRIARPGSEAMPCLSGTSPRGTGRVGQGPGAQKQPVSMPPPTGPRLPHLLDQVAHAPVPVTLRNVRSLRPSREIRLIPDDLHTVTAADAAIVREPPICIPLRPWASRS